METDQNEDIIPELDLNDPETVRLLSKKDISVGNFADIFIRLLPQRFSGFSLEFRYDSSQCVWRGLYANKDGSPLYTCNNVLPEEAARAVLYKLISDGIVRVKERDGVMQNGEKYVVVPASYNVCSACHFFISRCNNICQTFNRGKGAFFIRPGKKRNGDERGKDKDFINFE